MTGPSCPDAKFTKQGHGYSSGQRLFRGRRGMGKPAPIDPKINPPRCHRSCFPLCSSCHTRPLLPCTHAHYRVPKPCPVPMRPGHGPRARASRLPEPEAAHPQQTEPWAPSSANGLSWRAGSSLPGTHYADEDLFDPCKQETGEGHGHPLQYSCLENPMARGGWRVQSMGSQRAKHD